MDFNYGKLCTGIGPLNHASIPLSIHLYSNHIGFGRKKIIYFIIIVVNNQNSVEC
jgi:hypothetical protein